MGGKSQSMRLFDIFFLGPFMLWYATQSRSMPDWARLILGVSGVTTTLYNGRNYLLQRGAF